MRKTGFLIGISILALGAVAVFQNCEKKRSVIVTNQGSGPVIPPSNICHNNLVQSGDWTSRWGSMDQAGTMMPPYNACGAGNATRLFNATNEPNGFGQLVWSVGAIAQPRTGFIKRNVDVSFFVPTASMTSWNHVSGFPSLNSTSLGRVGASVFKDKIFIEIKDASCFGQNTLFGEQRLKDGDTEVTIEGDHWYRLHTQVKDLGNGGLEIKGILVDMATQKTIGTAVYGATCVPMWYRAAANSWLVGGTSMTNAGTSANLEIYVADVSATAN